MNPEPFIPYDLDDPVSVGHWLQCELGHTPRLTITEVRKLCPGVSKAVARLAIQYAGFSGTAIPSPYLNSDMNPATLIHEDQKPTPIPIFHLTIPEPDEPQVSWSEVHQGIDFLFWSRRARHKQDAITWMKIRRGNLV